MRLTFKKVCASSLMSGMLFAIVLALFACSTAFAQVDDEACQLPIIKEAFLGYLQKVDQAQVEKIQTRLNEKAYGPVDVDGVMGQETRVALQKLCQAYVLKSSDSLATDLVALLEGDAQPAQALQPAQVAKPAEVVASVEESLAPVESAEQATDDIEQARSTQTETQKPSEPVRNIDNSLAYYRWVTPEEDNQFFGTECAKGSLGPETELPEDVLKKLANIEGIPYPNEMLFDSALKQLFDNSGVSWQPYLCLIQKQAYQIPPTSIQKIELDGDGCGCSREFSSKVFGFYPAWLATGDTQTIDFSLFDRIIYYSLNLNSEGDIEEIQRWSDDSNIAGFINEAYKHYVDVDVNINIFGWQSWTEQAMNTAIHKVASTVKRKFEITDAGIQDYPQLIINSSSVYADGVVLNFKNYGAHVNDRHKIVAFVTKLADVLERSQNADIALNVMLDVDIDSIDDQIFLSDLEVLLIDEADDMAPIDHILMFLQESTSKNKKILRRKIEDEFRGAHRRDVMRKVIPIISPMGHQFDVQNGKVVPFAQFKDDLIYFQDNFAGAGLWPLPLDTDPDFDTIREHIIELYSAEATDNLLGTLSNTYVPQLCQFACPNRWLFRLSFDLLLGLLVVYLVAAVWINYLRALYKRYWRYFAAYLLLFMGVVLISLACDPYWRARADLVMAGIIISVFTVVVVNRVYKATRPPLP